MSSRAMEFWAVIAAHAYQGNAMCVNTLVWIATIRR